jgi:hypothetical protein
LLVAGGFFNCLKQQMKQSLDVATIVEEFKDILVTLFNASNQPSFELDVKSYKKIDYPLGDYAHLFGFNFIIVICFQSIHTSSDEYIMEIFFHCLLVWIVMNKKWC